MDPKDPGPPLYEWGESVADWYLRRGIEFSYADRIKELLFLVAAEKITAWEVTRFIEIWGLENGPGSGTWKVWLEGVRRIAAEYPGAYICLAAAEGSEHHGGQPARLIVAASIEKSGNSKPKPRKQRVKAGDNVK